MSAARRCGLLLLAAVLAVAVPACRKADPVASAPLSIRTEGGIVRGVAEADVRVFRGIPYAAPPVGPQRWRPPQAATPWEGTKEAEEFGPPCPQPGAPEPMTEDCLTLNVWTAADATEEAALPVMVWIHGGGFRSGSGRDPVSHGEHLARGGVVLVTLNYRLGALGFLAHPLLRTPKDDEPWANYGLLDMVSALQWVQRNIAAFGGDPSRVTIFGESAGGMAVHLLMVVPQAEGLFHRAIGMSGYGTWPMPRVASMAGPAAPKDVPSAESIAQDLIERATTPGAPPETVQELRAVPAARLAGAVEGLHIPVVDGEVVPEEPGILFARGEQHDVPFMTGGDSFDGAVMPWAGIPVDDYIASFGDDLARLRALYEDDFGVSEQLGASRLFGDARYVLAARYLAKRMDTVDSPGYLYYYSFVPRARRSEWPGAPHGSELGPLFGHVEDDDAVAVGRSLRQYWISFARTGDPNGSGLPAWPAYESASDQWLVIGEQTGTQTGVIQERLDLLESRYLERVGAPPTSSSEAAPGSS